MDLTLQSSVVDDFRLSLSATSVYVVGFGSLFNFMENFYFFSRCLNFYVSYFACLTVFVYQSSPWGRVASISACNILSAPGRCEQDISVALPTCSAFSFTRASPLILPPNSVAFECNIAKISRDCDFQTPQLVNATQKLFPTVEFDFLVSLCDITCKLK